jgi:hypothetical protein
MREVKLLHHHTNVPPDPDDNQVLAFPANYRLDTLSKTLCSLQCNHGREAGHACCIDLRKSPNGHAIITGYHAFNTDSITSRIPTNIPPPTHIASTPEAPVMKLATAITPASSPTPPPLLIGPMAPKHHPQVQTPPPSPPFAQNAPLPWHSHSYSPPALQRHTPPPPDTHHDSYFRRSLSL